MERELYKQRKLQFIETVNRIGNLPKYFQVKFRDGEDQRKWFDTIMKMAEFHDFVDEVRDILKQFDKKILTDEDKEREFIEKIIKIRRIPNRYEFYFSDNIDMNIWYMDYTNKNNSFAHYVKDLLPENIYFDPVEIYQEDIDEFKRFIKDKKRLPKYNEAKTERGIDLLVIYDKMESFDPVFYERVKHFLSNNSKKHLSPLDKKKQFLDKVKELKYIPILQEIRFSDGTDMFTWYESYKTKFPDLEEEVNRLINEPIIQKLNIYLIPNFKNKGGKFYTICSNVGEKLDISEITSFEELQKKDSTVKKNGGIILKQNQEIDSITLGGKKR